MKEVHILPADAFDASAEKLKKPCNKCPFRRDSPRTRTAAGGADPERYVGQAIGLFMLPCHQDGGFDDANPVGPGDTPGTVRVQARCGPDVAQCAGAAIYRANIGADVGLPPTFIKLPPDRELVFATAAELWKKTDEFFADMTKAFDKLNK